MNQLIRVIFWGGESDIVARAVSPAGNTVTLLHLVSWCLTKPNKTTKRCQLLPMAAIWNDFSHSLQAYYITYLIENDIVFLPLSSVLFISKHKHKCMTMLKWHQIIQLQLWKKHVTSKHDVKSRGNINWSELNVRG